MSQREALKAMEAACINGARKQRAHHGRPQERERGKKTQQWLGEENGAGRVCVEGEGPPLYSYVGKVPW